MKSRLHFNHQAKLAKNLTSGIGLKKKPKKERRNKFKNEKKRTQYRKTEKKQDLKKCR